MVLVLLWRREMFGEEDWVNLEGEGQQQQQQETRWGQLLEKHRLAAGAHINRTQEHPRDPLRKVFEYDLEKGWQTEKSGGKGRWNLRLVSAGSLAELREKAWKKKWAVSKLHQVRWPGKSLLQIKYSKIPSVSHRANTNT